MVRAWCRSGIEELRSLQLSSRRTELFAWQCFVTFMPCHGHVRLVLVRAKWCRARYSAAPPAMNAAASRRHIPVDDPGGLFVGNGWPASRLDVVTRSPSLLSPTRLGENTLAPGKVIVRWSHPAFARTAHASQASSAANSPEGQCSSPLSSHRPLRAGSLTYIRMHGVYSLYDADLELPS